MHSPQIIKRYAAPEAAFRHSALLITLNNTSVTEKVSIDEAVRYAWRLAVERRASPISSLPYFVD